jgi:hypothetical protein
LHLDIPRVSWNLLRIDDDDELYKATVGHKVAQCRRVGRRCVNLEVVHHVYPQRGTQESADERMLAESIVDDWSVICCGLVEEETGIGSVDGF